MKKGINQRIHEALAAHEFFYFTNCEERGCSEYHGKSPSQLMQFHNKVGKFEPQARVSNNDGMDMREEVESLGLQISKILIEKGNPHQRVEITQEGVKIVSDDSFMPNK